MQMRTAEPSPSAITEAAALLTGGGLVGMPTETVYGLAARYDDPRAIAAVFAAKERPLFDPLIVHVVLGPGERLAALAATGIVELSGFDARGRAVLAGLLERWPGPLTLVLPRTPSVPDLATSGLDTVAVREPAHPVARALISAAGPLVAPSANRFGRISPTCAADVVAELGDRVPLVLDGGRCAVGVESTIVRVDPDGTLTLLRPGAVEVAARASDGQKIQAPGQLASHYAPRTPLVLLDGPVRASDLDRPGRLGLLRAGGGAVPGVETVLLSATGDPAEMAYGLFAGLRRLDGLGLDLLLAEPCPTATGLGHAINDRLRRAAAR